MAHFSKSASPAPRFHRVSAPTRKTKPTQRPSEHFLHRAAPELQFWGYETGNVFAAFAGIGGFAVFSAQGGAITGIDDIAALLIALPDLAVTLGIILLVLLTFVIRAVLSEDAIARGLGLRADMALMRLSLALAALTLLWGANPMTLAAVCFASASALIRLTYHAPRFLTYGAAMLIAGGVCLMTFSALNLGASLVGLCLALNGAYVVVAGMMALASGIAMEAKSHPNALERALTWAADHLAKPAVFWLPASVKDTQPLYTSMWARLPWRVALAIAVTVTAVEGADALVLASLCWVLGDIAFGAMDRPKSA